MRTFSLCHFSIIVKGQEAELAGFFLYCTQILGWLPPLIFTYMNEQGIALKYGGMHLNIYLFIALVCYHCMLPWDQCLEAVQWNKMLNETDVPPINNERDGLGDVEFDDISDRRGVEAVFKRDLC